MRRLICAVVLGLLVTAGVGQAAGPKDYAKGNGTTGAIKFSFNATSDPAGGSPKGTMSVEFVTGQYFVAEVTCMRVIGNPSGGGYVALGGDVIRTNNPNQLDGVVMGFLDSGQPGGTGDQISNIFGFADSPPEDLCPTPPTFGSITTGDITVIDE